VKVTRKFVKGFTDQPLPKLGPMISEIDQETIYFDKKVTQIIESSYMQEW